MSDWDVVEHTPAPVTPAEDKSWTIAEETPVEKDKTSIGERLAHGFMNPVEGGGQLVSAIIPRQVERKLDEFNNFIADKTGLLRKLPEGGKQEQVRKREAEYQTRRGINAGTFDPAVAIGDMFNPINYIGLGAGSAAIRGTGAIANIARPLAEGVIGGGVGGAVQPATGKSFGEEKVEQVGIGSLFGGILSGAGTVASGALHGLGSWIARNYPENLQSDAIAKILKRIKQDERVGGPSAADAIDLVEQAKKPWGPSPDAKPLSLVDVTGENVEGLAGNVARAPGESRALAKNFLEKRDEQAAERLKGDISKYVSGGPTMFQATEALLDSRSAASKPVYQMAHALQNVWSPRLDEFFAAPEIREGLNRGYNLERIRSLARGTPLSATQMGVDIAVDGSIKILDKPNMLMLDMAKQGLDDMIANERNDLTGRLSKRGVALSELRKSFLKEIDALDRSGAYKKARETWQGFSASLDAMRVGKTVFSRSPEENAAEMANYSPANQEFIRMGLADALRERLMKAGFSGDESKQLLKNPWMREQMRPFFKNPLDADGFIEAVTAERRMFDKRFGILKGSQTAGRVAEDAYSAGELLAAGKIAKDFATGNWLQGIANSYKTWRDIGLKPNEEMNAKIAEILFSTKLPKDVAAAIRSGKTPGKINPLRKPASAIRETISPGAAAGAGAGLAAGATEGERSEEPPIPGARQAPDGKFYLPDPERPGKYLRVDR